jgi:hypothetical protein
VVLGQGHRGVEANDRESPRDMQDRLNDGLAHFGFQIIQLRRVVPRITGAVVAVVDVTRLSGPAIRPPEDNGCVGALIIMVLDLDLHPVVIREIRPFKAVSRIGRVRQGDEAFRMFDDPAGIDAHVVGHHVAGEPDSARRSAIAQVRVCRLAAQIFGKRVIVERVRGRDCVGIPRQLLDFLRCAAAFPDSDEP